MARPNPFSSPRARLPAGRFAWPMAGLGFVLLFGTLIGSFVSTQVMYLHHPRTHTVHELVDQTVEAFLSSPLSMSVGLFPTLGFYTLHGFLVIPGMLAAAVGSVFYVRRPRLRTAAVVFGGMVLWSHNNLLAFYALMSV